MYRVSEDDRQPPDRLPSNRLRLALLEVIAKAGALTPADAIPLLRLEEGLDPSRLGLSCVSYHARALSDAGFLLAGEFVPGRGRPFVLTDRGADALAYLDRQQRG